MGRNLKPLRVRPRPLRLVVCSAVPPRSLTEALVVSCSNRLGSRLLTFAGRFDGCRAVSSWGEALGWILWQGGRRKVREVQIWTHGKWGEVRFGADVVDADSFSQRSPLSPLLRRLSRVLVADALVWFRTCETFGAFRGSRFAQTCVEELGCRVAGHTHLISAWQSGLHSLSPGGSIHWDPAEGLASGTPGAPLRALRSSATAPNTVHALNMSLPEGF